jgi:predicted GH43/DUF377 family glycosyl hydrolase
MIVTRAACNPLITPADVQPSSSELSVVCAFNPATARYNGETLLLLRVAEAVREVAPDEVAVPVVDGWPHGPCIRVERIPRNTPGLNLSDSRAIILKDRCLLTSLSHLRLARSTDGVSFTVDHAPALFPSEPYEEYGMEDPRIAKIDDTYYITYTAVSRHGIAVGLASTQDFRTFTRHGLIMGPENKDVMLFAGRVNGKYYMLHRPTVNGVGTLQIWLAESPDMLHWGGHRPLAAMRPDGWDSHRIGGGDVPFLTDEGWLTIYHGVNREQGYCLGALLLDRDDPSRVIARSSEPLLLPEAEYERVGFYGNVVFTCGTVLDDEGMLHIYYGSADEHTCRASIALDDVLDSLKVPAARVGVAA